MNQPRDETWTIGQLLNWTARFFSEKKLDSPRLDAEVLLAHVLSCRRIDLYALFDAEVTAADRTQFRELVKQRTQGKPVAYLVGKREFYSIEFEVDPRVLIPRPETEVLVSRAIASLPKDEPSRFLDVGTGSSAIAVAIALHRPQSHGVAIDIDAGALEVAGRNVDRHQLESRLELRQGSLLTTLTTDERFDLVVSNPPYIREKEWETLSPDVRDFEPKIALVAGPDGLMVLRDLIDHAPEYLRPGGWLMLEFGIDHAEPLTQLIEQDGRYNRSEIIADDARIPRLLAVQTSTHR